VSVRLRHGLSKWQRQIMEAIYRRKRATAREIWNAMPDPPSYSAVRATLIVLEGKGLLMHRRQGRNYLYLPTISYGRARHSAIRQLLETYFDDSVEAAVAAVIRADRNKLTEQDYRRLIELIRKAEQEAKP